MQSAIFLEFLCYQNENLFHINLQNSYCRSGWQQPGYFAAGTSAYTPTSTSTQVVPDISPDLAALNLNMEDLTQSAYDLSTGVPSSVYMAQLSHFSVPNLSSNHYGYGHQYDLSSSQSHDLSRDMLGHNLMTGTAQILQHLHVSMNYN